MKIHKTIEKLGELRVIYKTLKIKEGLKDLDELIEHWSRVLEEEKFLIQGGTVKSIRGRAPEFTREREDYGGTL